MLAPLPESGTPRARSRWAGSRALVVSMFAAVAAVAGLAYWDTQREAAAALAEFAGAQALLADGLARALAERLAVSERDALDAARGMREGEEREAKGEIHLRAAGAATRGPGFVRFELGRDPPRLVADVALSHLLAPLRAMDRPSKLRVLVRPPGGLWVQAADGEVARAPGVAAAASASAPSVRLSRSEAAELGLPARTAMAGLARVDTGALGEWRVAVVATAESERDREVRGERRLLLGVAVAAGLVLAFGGAAVKKQQRELALTHELAIAAIESERNARLGTADKLATMGAFATGIAHEVATPLGVIVARAEQILGRGDVDERARRAAEQIVSQADRIHEVVRGFLALSRGHLPRLEDARPRALALAALELVAHRFARAGVSLAKDLDAEVPLVACDARMFEQVLVNLLLNACEACKEGGKVSLAIQSTGEGIAFVVTDDGVGIDAQAAARATEPFFTTKSEGTGLGLAIANEIVNHHRGTLVLRPRADGRGTEAIVTLPAHRRLDEPS